MSTTTYRNIKGTFDILPEATGHDGTHEAPAAAWRHLEERVREVFRAYHFEEIRTPVLEPTELIARGVGEATDIVSKEMFAFERSGTNYVLRPEVTAPVMRAFLQHHLDQRGGAQKLFYIGPCFRAEQPQKGRYRQFHQFGCELIGAEGPLADAEVIASMMAIYRAFGIEQTRLRINTLGSPNSRPLYREALQEYFEPYADELSEASRRRLESNPLRILDTKVDRERELLEEAPRLIDFVGEAAIARYDAVKEALDTLGIEYEEDPFLVRGLDYYTHTTFELESPALGAQSALAGGGRYDLLGKALGSDEAVPAVGFAAGIERLFIALEENDYEWPEADVPDLFLVAMGERAQQWVLQRAQQMRDRGLRVAIDVLERSIGKQMKEADRQNVRYATVIGDNELEAGETRLKHMKTGEQETISFDDLEVFLERTR